MVDRNMVASGVSTIAAGAVSGWGLSALIATPGIQKKLGIVDPKRIRQAHLDVIIMGGLVTAASLVEDAPRWAQNATRIGAWTNSLLFVPLAFTPDAPKRLPYQAASVASFTITTAGWVGLARAARRAARRVS